MTAHLITLATDINTVMILQQNKTVLVFLTIPSHSIFFQMLTSYNTLDNLNAILLSGKDKGDILF